MKNKGSCDINLLNKGGFLKMKHKIFELALKLSNYLKRSISVYRTSPHNNYEIVSIYVYRTNDRVVISKVNGTTLPIIYGDGDYFLREIIFCVFNNEITANFDYISRCLEGESVKHVRESVEDIHLKLEKTAYYFLRLLRSEELYRVNPYNRNERLEGEKTDVDSSLENIISGLKTWSYKLSKCEMKPGIINPEKDFINN